MEATNKSSAGGMGDLCWLTQWDDGGGMRSYEELLKSYGGKATNLAKMSHAGFEVPPAFGISVEAHRKFLAHQPADAEEYPNELRETILNFYEELERRWLQGGETRMSEEFKVAVRSSGLAEDSKDSAFAGMHDTLLDIHGSEAVLEAVRVVWRSAKSERALAYRNQHTTGRNEDDSIGVVVQAMVPATSAGVVFTVHPLTNDPSQVVINVVPGLGERLVSGQVTPDEYVVDRSGGLISKHQNPSLGSGGYFPDALLPRLVETALRIEAFFGSEGSKQPQDIEWAWDEKEGRLWILQSRPVTTFSSTPQSQGKVDLFFNKHTKESMGWAATPLTWTTFQHVINRALEERYAAKGVSYFEKTQPTTTSRAEEHGSSYLSSWNGTESSRSFYALRWGRVYMNLTLTDELNHEEFGTGVEETKKEVEGSVPEELMRQYLGAGYQRSISNKAQGIANVLGTLWNSRSVSDGFEQALPEYSEYCARWRKPHEELVSRSISELQQLFGNAIEKMIQFGRNYVDLMVTVSVFMAVVKKALSSNQEAAEAISLLISGLGEVSTALQNLELQRLSEEVRNDARVKAYFDGITPEAASVEQSWETWREELQDTAFQKGFDLFLDRFGFRSEKELEVGSPRWRETPHVILQMIHSSYHSSADSKLGWLEMKEKMAEMSKKRLDAFKKVLSLQSILVRPLVKWAIERLQAMMRLRENSKTVLVQFIDIQRSFVRAIAEKLVEQGVLKQADDVFFLEYQHLLQSSKNAFTESAPRLQDIIDENRALFEKLSSLQPPDVFVGNKPYFSTSQSLKLADGARELRGIGASAGQAIGIARVLRSPAEGHRLSPGDILVAETTDPAWTPLFLKASGVAVAYGGLLSHGGITAREFGLPAVLGISNLLANVVDGQRIAIDGSRGIVTLID